MMAHYYECSGCRNNFKVGDNDDYDSDPQTRKCLYCGQIGGILYHGYSGFVHSCISDCLDRVLNPATGKYYDSKSKYYADLKATGHVVVESGIVPEKREQRGDYNVYKELKEAAQRHGLIS